ncbi:MAG: nucleotidyltransferase domain-containing protein [Verrucomicrobia bacterium]|nr:nucleotidyltransferase domain-containing protein [Verrucomicrobiota bacterium]
MTTSIELVVSDKRQEIFALCAGLSVHELRVFGSAVTGRFDPLHSDIDIVVDFYDPQAPGIADRYMALALGLEAIFQRPVDVVTKQAMKNPVFRSIVGTTSELLYAA